MTRRGQARTRQAMRVLSAGARAGLIYLLSAQAASRAFSDVIIEFERSMTGPTSFKRHGALRFTAYKRESGGEALSRDITSPLPRAYDVYALIGVTPSFWLDA